MKVILCLIALCWAPFVLAQKKGSIQRFGESDLLVVNTKVRFTTLIQLPEGEEVSEVTCGDKEFWVIEGKDGMVYVKPSKEGAVTNVNVISKNKAVYSFLVREITKPGLSKEKVDLKVILGGDEVPKLRKERDNLEEALARSEHSLRELNDKAETEKAKKKDGTPPPVEEPKKERPPEPKTETKPKAETPLPQPVEQKALPVAAPSAAPPEAPIVRAYAIVRPEGFIRKTGRAVGQFFQKVSRALRLY